MNGTVGFAVRLAKKQTFYPTSGKKPPVLPPARTQPEPETL
jgi:hypothetical protein